MLYTDWFYLFNTASSSLELVLGLERLPWPRPWPRKFLLALHHRCVVFKFRKIWPTGNR